MGDPIVISDGSSQLTLARLGDPEAGYPTTAYSTRLEIKSGPFSAAIEGQADNYAAFLLALRTLHETLAGEARLGFWNEAHSVVFSGDARGNVTLTVDIHDGHRDGRLTVPMLLNQSHLPEIISAIAKEFPSG